MNIDILDVEARVDAAATLVGEFFEEYFSLVDDDNLIFDATHRRNVMSAKVFAILELLTAAKKDIKALEREVN